MTIKCIIFDVGGVLLKESVEMQHNAINKELGQKLLSRKDLLHRKSLAGGVAEKEYYKILSKKSGIAAPKLRVLFSAKFSKHMKINNDTLRILKKLKNDGYRICILSNVIPEHKRINKNLGVYSHAHHLVLSCDVRTVKPGSGIFKISLKKMKSKPEECVYIEDRKEYLETPKKLGMNVIHFKNAKQLKSDLRKYGVKI